MSKTTVKQGVSETLRHLGGNIFHPLHLVLGGKNVKNHCETRGFLDTPPLNLGVNLPSLNLGGLGLQDYTSTSPPAFSKKATRWGKKWPVPMNLPFFAVEAYVPGVGSRIRPKKKIEKCLSAGTKIDFSR